MGCALMVIDRHVVFAVIKSRQNPAERLQTTKLIAVNGGGVLGSTFKCDVDFVQGTDSFLLRVLLHCL
jgi:hypothetical protein